ncbi:MAG: dienelactone hydrolase family protein [Chloroflexota bacterium]
MPRTALRIATTLLPALLLVMAGSPPGALAASPAPAASPSPDAAAPGASVQMELTVTAGDRSFPAVVWLPAQATDGTAPTAPAPGPWPVVVFGHGYLSPVEAYRTLLSGLAADGFVVIAPRSGGELFPSHGAFAADLSGVVDWVTVEASRAGSPLQGIADPTRVAVSGHSMGGGAAVLAAAADPRFRTVATLAAAETRPSAVAAAATLTTPVLFIGGDADTIAPVATNQQPMFAAVADADAQLRVIAGGSHCGFTDLASGGNGLLGRLSGLVCDEGSIPVATQLAVTGTLLRDWLRLQLDGATDLAATVWPADGVMLDDGTTATSHHP